MKIDASKLFFLLLLTAFLLPGTILAQGGKKDDEIRVPAEALRPPYTKSHFDDELKNFKTWLESIGQLPATGEEFKRRAQEFSEASETHISLQLRNMRSIATNPDLEEVTKLPRSWYGQIYNAALPLQSAVKILNGIKVVCVEQKYQAAKKEWTAAVEETLAVIDKPPKKLSKEALEPIIAKNRERRKKEYIKWYKAKQAAELKKAKEEAAKKKSGGKPKKKSKETEE